MNITLQQMLTVDAVVRQGSIQEGAKYLNKTHPGVISTIKKLESELGFALFDRSGYRLVLTSEGKAFYTGMRKILANIQDLETHISHIKAREEAELNIVIGDITPASLALSILREFSNANLHTRLNLSFGNLYGPNELLFDGEADMIIHHIDYANASYEYIDFCTVNVIPVAAPGFFGSPVDINLRYEDIQDYRQCIIRDTSTHSEKLNRFIVENAPYMTVGDQHTKKEVILQGMAWGHMPVFLIEEELQQGRLVSMEGNYIKGVVRDLVVARLSDQQQGIMAEKLWAHFKKAPVKYHQPDK